MCNLELCKLPFGNTSLFLLLKSFNATGIVHIHWYCAQWILYFFLLSESRPLLHNVQCMSLRIMLFLFYNL